MRRSATIVLALASLPLALAAPASGSWWQSRDTPVAALFQKRYTPSPSDSNFTANYPPPYTPPADSWLPASWTAKLASISMPNFTASTNTNGYPTYAGGEAPTDANICSFTYQCVTKDDIYNAPNGSIALTFDDGPTSASPTLYEFLETNNATSKATHFMIGSNILTSPNLMQQAASQGGHIAVHTWSHMYTTTLTDNQVLGELGWTMQIISDLNGGRLPKFWRPPYGDVDNRVRAIAKGVFGLETVVWNQDSADWAIGTPGSTYTIENVEQTMTGWFSGTKSPGLLMLEHELNNNTVDVFMHEYPIMVSNGWNIRSVPDTFSMNWYQNAGNDNTGSVTSMSVGANISTLLVNSTTSAMSTTMSQSTTSSMSTTISSAMSTTSQTSAAATPNKAAGSATQSSGASRLSGSQASAAVVLLVLLLGLAM